MKCAVAIVLALIGLAMAHPSSYGIGLAHAPFVLPSAVYTSSVINHGVTIPRVAHVTYPIIKTPIYTPIIKTPIITSPILSVPIIKSPLISTLGLGGLGHGWH